MERLLVLRLIQMIHMIQKVIHILAGQKKAEQEKVSIIRDMNL